MFWLSTSLRVESETRIAAATGVTLTLAGGSWAVISVWCGIGNCRVVFLNHLPPAPITMYAEVVSVTRLEPTAFAFDASDYQGNLRSAVSYRSLPDSAQLPSGLIGDAEARNEWVREHLALVDAVC